MNIKLIYKEDDAIQYQIVSANTENELSIKVKDLLSSKKFKKRNVEQVKMWKCFSFNNEEYVIQLNSDCCSYSITKNGQYIKSDIADQVCDYAKQFLNQIGYVKPIINKKENPWKEYAKSLEKVLNYVNKALYINSNERDLLKHKYNI